MKLLFKDQVVQINDSMTLEDIFTIIHQWLGDEYFCSHFIVDGNVTHVGLEELIMMEDIQNIEVVGVETDVFIFEILQSTEEYLENVSYHLPSLGETFKKEPLQKDWVALEDLFVGLQWLVEASTAIDQFSIDQIGAKNVIKHQGLISEHLSCVEEHLVNKDYFLLGQLLIDLSVSLEGLLLTIKEMLNFYRNYFEHGLH